MLQQRNIWRFTLRELFFAITAICAILGLIVSNRPFRFSQFHATIDVKRELSNISESYGIEFHAPSILGISGGTDHEHDFLIKSPNDQYRTEMMAKLRLAIESSLSKNGCTIYNRSGNGDSNRTSRFRLLYKCGKTHGLFYANSISTTGGEWRLIVVRNEW